MVGIIKTHKKQKIWIITKNLTFNFFNFSIQEIAMAPIFEIETFVFISYEVELEEIIVENFKKGSDNTTSLRKVIVFLIFNVIFKLDDGIKSIFICFFVTWQFQSSRYHISNINLCCKCYQMSYDCFVHTFTFLALWFVVIDFCIFL